MKNIVSLFRPLFRSPKCLVYYLELSIHRQAFFLLFVSKFITIYSSFCYLNRFKQALDCFLQILSIFHSFILFFRHEGETSDSFRVKFVCYLFASYLCPGYVAKENSRGFENGVQFENKVAFCQLSEHSGDVKSIFEIKLLYNEHVLQ